MARRTTRRELLAGMLGVSAGALLTACGPQAPAQPAPTKPAATTAPAAPAPTAAPAAKPADAAKPAAESKPAADKPAGGPTRGGTFNYAEAGDFNDFNPWTYTAVNFELYNQVFSRLMWKDGAGTSVGDLAESWQMAPDNLSLQLKLRGGIKWHDGKELAAEDFVTMWGYLKDEALSKHVGVQKIRGITAPIKDLQAPDRSTVELRFDAPVPYVYDILDYLYAIRIDDPSDPSMQKKPPVGTGPFKMGEWVTGQYAKFVKNPDYYNRDVPYLDEVVFKRLTQAETLVPNLKSGAVDGILMTSLGDVGPLQADASVQLDVNENAGSIFNIQVNVTKPPLDKKEVRQALSYSLNRVELANSAFFGVSKPIASPFYSSTSLGHHPDLVMAHPFDLDKARALLDGAGAGNRELSIVVTPAWPQMKLFALIWQQDLAKIGIRLRINEVENAKFYEINGAKDLQGEDMQAWLNARTTRDPAIFWSTQRNYRAGPTTGTHGYLNEDMERLITSAASEADVEKRRATYRTLNEMVLDSSHVIQLATNPRVFAYGKARDVRVDLNGNLVMDRAWMAR
jgi:peptide/nickel transport system substrate-binding protein